MSLLVIFERKQSSGLYNVFTVYEWHVFFKDLENQISLRLDLMPVLHYRKRIPQSLHGGLEKELKNMVQEKK